MPNKKPTDSEIVKALECCLADKMICEECPIQDECESHPLESILAKYSLDLINSLQARIGVYETCNARKDEAIEHLEREVKRLQAENEGLKSVNKNQKNVISMLNKPFNRIKAEARKEFAERLKKEQYLSIVDMVVSVTAIDNLLKELEKKENK